jgi:hypothetical protein
MLRRSFLGVLGGAPALAFSKPVELARNGRALIPVVIASEASQRVAQAANYLATYLGTIAGTRFEVIEGKGTEGIAVGLPRHFPALGLQDRWSAPEVAQREDYLIDARGRGAMLLGASDLAVEHAVWGFLYQLGYRQFFPGERWEVVPSIPDLSFDFQVRASPSYRTREIWYEYEGLNDYRKAPYRQWAMRNRARSGIDLRINHSYPAIIRALKTEFDRHPEYYPLINGERRATKEAKLCISNEQLRKLIVEYELEQFRKNPDLDSVSLEPGDSGGWCECDNCNALGSISNRVVLLANDVAAAVSGKYPGKLVGMLAYYTHSAPPTIRVHPNLVVSVATAYIQKGFTVEELFAGWAKQGATLGVYDYFSVNAWGRSQPARSRAAKLEYLATTIPRYHASGARFMSAETGGSWGPDGLGFYVASRLLWDVLEAKDVSAIVDDFLKRAFGPAEEPMRRFYSQLDGAAPPASADDRLGAMFRALSQARRMAAGDSGVKGRVDDLTLYAHYASLFRQYDLARGEDRQAAFEPLMRHLYRMRTTMLVNTVALYRILPWLDKSVSMPPEAVWQVPEGKNPWKSSVPFSAEEITSILNQGMRRHPVTNGSPTDRI